ncbi:MAG TPA: prepilin-type N-terminal cleavage/methylation domain-containing protein [Candidatus Binatia bacterium]|nr:prepilin-type N-terminal cleavage/methylation domain-containing protein [Candidatus Binatia bacterium]
MNTSSTHSVRSRALLRSSAFTLIETMITMVITVIVVGAILAAYMYGMRMFQITRPKLTASDGARNAVGKMIQQIRSAGGVAVGTGDAKTFTPAPLNSKHVGNAIEVYPDGTNTIRWVRYFVDTNDDCLKRFSSENPKFIQVLARDVTNDVAFAAEDYLGNPVTNSINNYVIALKMQFSQIKSPGEKMGPSKAYDFYQLNVRVTRRNVL